MRTTLILLCALLLCACTDNSASYSASGSSDIVTVHAEQEYIWSEELTLSLVMSHLPDCQRRVPLSKEAPADIDIALFAAGDNLLVVKLGKQIWQVNTQTCATVELSESGELGARIGNFKVADNQLVFEAVAGTAGGAPADGASVAAPAAAPVAAAADAPAADAPAPAPAAPAN